MRLIKLSGLIFTLLVLFSVLYYGLNNQSSDVNSTMTDEPVPAFSLASLNTDRMLDHSLFRGDELTLLNIWASWCAACKDEHPFLLKLAQSGISIVGLNYRDNKKDALEVINKDGNPYREIIYDPNGNLALDLGVIGAPETFLIDGEGRIVTRFSGVIDAKVWESQFATHFK